MKKTLIYFVSMIIALMLSSSCASETNATELVSIPQDQVEVWQMEYLKSNHYFMLEPEYQLDTSVTGHVIHVSELNKLYAHCPDCKGVRIYFGAELEGDHTYSPGFILVNEGQDGNDQAFGDDMILMLESYGSLFVSQSLAKRAHEVWEDFIYDAQEESENLLHVESYVFLKTDLSRAMEKSDSGQILISFALKTLREDDTEYVRSSEEATGKKVYGMVITPLDMNEVPMPGEALNFARPCPMVCGNLKFYNY